MILRTIVKKMLGKYKPNYEVKPFSSTSLKEYDTFKSAGKKLIICTDVGRSGTRWLTEIFSQHKGVIGTCERRSSMVAFYRYMKWNNIEISTQGYIDLLKHDIVQDWKKGNISFVSELFDLNLKEIIDNLNPDHVIWALNEPIHCATSFYNKGWYKSLYKREDSSQIAGINPYIGFFHRNFTRLEPIGDEYIEWVQKGRFQKLGWFWNRMNQIIMKNILDSGTENVYLYRLKDADQNYEWYKKFAIHFDLGSLISEKKFLSLKGKSVKKLDNLKNKEIESQLNNFKNETQEMMNIYNNFTSGPINKEAFKS